MLCAVFVAVGLLSACDPISVAQNGTVGAQLSWVNPTQREDGTALLNDSFTYISWGPHNGPYTVGNAKVLFPGVTYNDTTFKTGTRCYVAFAVDANGLVSAASNEVCKVITANPNTVTNLTVK